MNRPKIHEALHRLVTKSDSARSRFRSSSSLEEELIVLQSLKEAVLEAMNKIEEAKHESES